MSSAKHEDSPSGGTDTPRRVIHTAYQNSVEARRQYYRAIGTSVESAAHEQLHDTTLDYLEVLRPILTDSTAGEKYWSQDKHQAQLWPQHAQRQAVLRCPTCAATYDRTQDGVGSPCPSCENTVLEPDEIPVRENGRIVYEWAYGLERLDETFAQTRDIEESYTDALGTHHASRTERDLIGPTVLVRAARAMDRALNDLGLHIDVKLPVNTDAEPI